MYTYIKIRLAIYIYILLILIQKFHVLSKLLVFVKENEKYQAYQLNVSNLT